MNWFGFGLIGAIGGGLVLPAWLFWYRWRCLADPRYPKSADGTRVFAGQTIDSAEAATLVRRQRRVLLRAAAVTALLLLFMIRVVILDPSRFREPWAGIVLLFFLVAIAAVIHFSPRCPRCEYPLWLQTQLALPKACERCGVSLEARPSS